MSFSRAKEITTLDYCKKSEGFILRFVCWVNFESVQSGQVIVYNVGVCDLPLCIGIISSVE